MKVQNMGGKVHFSCKGKICIFNEGEGDGTEFRLPFTISSTLQNTLINKELLVKFWLNYVELVEGLTSNCNLKERLVSL